MKTTRRAIERMPHLRWRIGAVACAGALSLMCLPTSAWANAGTTQVTVEADPSSVIEYDVPTELPFYVAADGTLTGPTPSACQIVNKSVFGIHVTEVSVTKADGWNLATSAQSGSMINSIDFQFGPKKQIDAFAAMEIVDVSNDASFNMGYKGSGKEAVSIDSSGDVARLTHDITKPIPSPRSAGPSRRARHPESPPRSPRRRTTHLKRRRRSSPSMTASHPRETSSPLTMPTARNRPAPPPRR